MRSLRLTSFTLIGLLLVGLALPALAAEDGGGSAEPATTDSVIQSGYEPAVVVEPPSATEVEPAWTTKFLVPTGLLIAAIAMLATVVMYFVRVVRTRYKVVE
jgi:hypothetical protein